MQEQPLVFLRDMTVYFQCGSLNICCLFGVSRCYPQCAECVSREKEAIGRASSQCLVAGLLTVARTCRKLA